MSTHNERGTDQQPWKSLIFASQNSAINGTKIALLRDENAKTNLCELAFANQSLTIPYNEHLVVSRQTLDLMNKFTLFPAASLNWGGFTIRVKLWIYHCNCQFRHEHRLFLVIFSVSELRNDLKLSLSSLAIFYYFQMCSTIFRFHSGWFTSKSYVELQHDEKYISDSWIFSLKIK